MIKLVKLRFNIINIKNVLVITDIIIKETYNKKYKTYFIKIKNYVILRLYRGYKLFIVVNIKLFAQLTGSFKIIKRIKKLAYRL